jgi:hypothetical protein
MKSMYKVQFNALDKNKYEYSCFYINTFLGAKVVIIF